jgi:lipoprotein-anchoring transpeptidase ErfK/SrfK
MLLNRRRLLVAAASTAGGAALSGCMSTPRQAGTPLAGRASETPDYALVYAEVKTEPFPVPAFDWTKADKAYLRQDVAYDGREKPGTIIVDPKNRFLTHVGEGGRARRYGVGVGKEGFGWSGTADIRSKQEWPDWYPPAEMIKRRPDIKPQLAKLQSGIGVKGGASNPLGARALYLWQGNKDTLYRIHGTLEPESIGTAVSSGCIRMINQDALDLYARTPIGTKVIVVG